MWQANWSTGAYMTSRVNLKESIASRIKLQVNADQPYHSLPRVLGPCLPTLNLIFLHLQNENGNETQLKYYLRNKWDKMYKKQGAKCWLFSTVWLVKYNISTNMEWQPMFVWERWVVRSKAQGFSLASCLSHLSLLTALVPGEFPQCFSICPFSACVSGCSSHLMWAILLHSFFLKIHIWFGLILPLIITISKLNQRNQWVEDPSLSAVFNLMICFLVNYTSYNFLFESILVME